MSTWMALGSAGLLCFILPSGKSHYFQSFVKRNPGQYYTNLRISQACILFHQYSSTSNLTIFRVLKVLVSRSNLEILHDFINPNRLSNKNLVGSQTSSDLSTTDTEHLTHAQSHWDIWAFVITQQQSHCFTEYMISSHTMHQYPHSLLYI